MCDKERPGCPTVFLDRDGTINEEVNYLHRPEDLRLLPGAAQAIRLWNENGFRVVNNCGKDGMQTVQHLHFHLLGKRQMGWPPFPA